jgi:diguanylate cyclase (GGDEF)-like protein
MSIKLSRESGTSPARARLNAWFARWNNALAGFLVFCIALAIGEYIVELEVRDRAALQRVALFSYMSNLRSHVNQKLSSVLARAAGLESYLVVRHTDLDRAEVTAILEELSRSSTTIRNISVAVGYRIAFMYPAAGNEKALGLDYRTLRGQWPDVEKASQTGNPVLVGPLDLVQGGRGIIYRSPIFVRGHYWGMLSTVYDAPMLFQYIFGSIEDERFDFAVRKVSANTARLDDAIWGPQSFFEESDVEVQQISLSGGPWEIAINPSLEPVGGHTILLLRGLSLLLAVVLGWSIYLSLGRRTLLSQIAMHDPLTGLPNRRLVEDRLKRALQRQKRNRHAVGVILFIDLDEFKRINDVHGHRAGDSVLQAVGARITRALRATDTIGRWGGDEMLILMENTDRATADELTERIRQIFELPVAYQDTMIKVGASIGRAVFPDDGTSLIDLVRVADKRMYEDKQHRRDIERRSW